MTHTERVLELLSDGLPHSHREGYRLNVMLHSRISDLRRQGHSIRCWRDGDDYLYQLQSTASVGVAAPSSARESGADALLGTVQPAGEDRAKAPDGAHPLIGQPSTAVPPPTSPSAAEVGSADLGSPSHVPGSAQLSFEAVA